MTRPAYNAQRTIEAIQAEPGTAPMLLYGSAIRNYHDLDYVRGEPYANFTKNLRHLAKNYKKGREVPSFPFVAFLKKHLPFLEKSLNAYEQKKLGAHAKRCNELYPTLDEIVETIEDFEKCAKVGAHFGDMDEYEVIKAVVKSPKIERYFYPIEKPRLDNYGRLAVTLAALIAGVIGYEIRGCKSPIQLKPTPVPTVQATYAPTTVPTVHYTQTYTSTPVPKKSKSKKKEVKQQPTSVPTSAPQEKKKRKLTEEEGNIKLGQ